MFEYGDAIKMNHQSVQECELYGLSYRRKYGRDIARTNKSGDEVWQRTT